MVAGVAVVLFAAVFAYLALVVLTRVDAIFSPGSNINIPGLSRKIPGVDSDDIPQERVNILVMGMDQREIEARYNTPTRTDTMFVITIDPKEKTAGILGIPRDLWVDIPGKQGGTFKERINTAYHYGELNKYDGGGAGLAMRVVESTLGIDLHHYVVINFEGFIDVIDTLGGIDIDVPEELYDPTYSWTELPGDYDPQYFEPGVQHMDGKTALAYSRTRTYSNDLDRIQRQQRVIFATIDRALGIGALNNAMDLWRQFKDNVDTDFNDIQLTGLLPLARQISPERISALSLGAAVTDYVTSEGAAVLIGDKAAMNRIVQALFSDTSLLDEKATVLVQNGAGVAGKEEDVADYLVELGFPPERVTKLDEAVDGLYYEMTRIIVYTGKTKTAQRLAELLGLPQTSVAAAASADAAYNPGRADIVLLLGADAQIARSTLE